MTQPSAAYYALHARTRSELEETFLRGHTPELEALAGWEFCGTNHPAWTRLAGIKKFIKGFEPAPPDAKELRGYNLPVRQNGIWAPWIPKRLTSESRFGYYRVAPVVATDIDNEYLHSVLLDYGKGGNPRLDPSRNLRDYLVQVDADNLDLYLGKAYYALGPARLATNFFLLERLRQAPA